MNIGSIIVGLLVVLGGGEQVAAVRPKINARHYITTNAVELAALPVLVREYLQSECEKPSTLRYYTTDLTYLLEFASKRLVKPVSHLHWADLDRKLLAEFRDARLKIEAPATVSRRVDVVKRFCKWVGARHRVDNPAERLKRVQLTSPGFKGLREDEYQALKRAARAQVDPVYRFIPLLLCGTGLRCTEAAGLTMGSVSADQAWLVNVFGKGSKLRCVPLLEEVIGELQIYLFWRERFPSGRNTPLLLAPRTIGMGKVSKMGEKTIYNCMRDVGAEAGIECHPHMARHTYAHRWLDAQPVKGFQEVETLALILGHSRTTTTARYLERDQQDMLASVRRMSL